MYILYIYTHIEGVDLITVFKYFNFVNQNFKISAKLIKLVKLVKLVKFGINIYEILMILLHVCTCT